MKFTEIYPRAIKYWPDQIQIADGFPTGTSGFQFPALSKAWDEAEEAVDSEDHWTSLAVWCMFQAFHTEARALHQAGQGTLRPREVPVSNIESRISEALKVEGWAEYNKAYVNDLTPL